MQKERETPKQVFCCEICEFSKMAPVACMVKIAYFSPPQKARSIIVFRNLSFCLELQVTLTYQIVSSKKNLQVKLFTENSFFLVNIFYLRILTGKKHHQMKLQRLQKVQIWAFGLLVQQLYKSFLNWNKIFKKIK